MKMGPVDRLHGRVPPVRPQHTCHRGGRGYTNNPCPQGRGSLRHRGGCARGDREPMPVRASVARGVCSHHQVWLVMLAERR